ncbi:MAG: TM2 domain-containing protein [Muribaculaceae bacterium]|nr:TM2 domain-containing protein [Muribaculaceae bacterium]
MDAKKVDLYMLTNSKYFPMEMLPYVRQRLETLDETQATAAMYMQFKDPTVALIVSILAGTLGVDRFYIDDILSGVCKLITGGGCGIWWFVDMFLIQNATRKKNLEKFIQATQLY